MMASAVRLGGVALREFIPGILARPANGAGERVISVGISAAFFCFLEFRRSIRGTNLRLSGIQMAITAQHPYRVAASGTVKRFEDAQKNAFALRALFRPGFDEVMVHR